MVNQYLYNKLSEITTKVYPDFIPMAVVYPAIMIELIELENELYKGGSDVTSQMWDVHIVSPTVEARNLLAIEVIEKIEHKSDGAYYIDDCVLIDTSTGFNKDVEMYYTILSFEFRVKDHTSYSEDAFEWDFEGTMAIGEFEGEGEVMEYGYRAGWGDDYGSMVDFYTYYEYAGLFWANETLYVYGVDVDLLQIDGVNYANGTLSEFGFTFYTFAENPLVGGTIDIKIKGTATETWDYEGTLTVGEETPYKGAGFYYGANYGTVTPETNYRLYFKTTTNELYGLGLMNYCKINSSLYQKFNFQTFGELARGTLFIGSSDPFPAVGQTCTIKVKL